jgi:hypothetical protein
MVAELVPLDQGCSALKLPAITLEPIQPGVRTDIRELKRS